MSKVLVNETSLTAIADAIREKNGETTTYKPAEMSGAISALAVGTDTIPDNVFSGDATNSYKFAGRGWNNFVREYSDRFERQLIAPYISYGNDSPTLAYSIYDENGKHLIKFKMADNQYCQYAFADCSWLKELDITGTTGFNTDANAEYMFNRCYRLRNLPADLFGTEATNGTYYDGTRGFMFEDCYSLVNLPNLKPLGASTNPDSLLYHHMADGCYALDEIKDLPVIDIELDGGNFYHIAYFCNRLKDFTFETNTDGTPKTARWANETLNLTYYVGWADNYTRITQYNSGITNRIAYATDTRLIDDCYVIDQSLSRYHAGSAIATIHSLPDCSAYIAETGKNNNTIKFVSTAGKSSGGAIENMSETTIAEASAKGWTVAFTDYPET